jgi:hypothetical protein
MCRFWIYTMISSQFIQLNYTQSPDHQGIMCASYTLSLEIITFSARTKQTHDNFAIINNEPTVTITVSPGWHKKSYITFFKGTDKKQNKTKQKQATNTSNKNLFAASSFS